MNNDRKVKDEIRDWFWSLLIFFSVLFFGYCFYLEVVGFLKHFK